MNNKPIILVTGATGAQGGSVARSLLSAGQFAVRILTRNASSPKAAELQQAGAEVVEGDMDNKDSLIKAMQGCYGVFGVTNFWEHYEKEYQQGKNLIEAVKESNISHFVLHTLPDYKALSQGKYAVPHCDIKAELERYCRQLGLKATFVQIAFYYENFLNFFPLQDAGNGTWTFGFPQGDTPLAMAAAEDMGPVVRMIFEHPEAYMNRVVGVVGAHDTCTAYAETMSRVLGKNIAYRYIPRDEYVTYGFPGAEEIANMFEVQRLHIPDRGIDLIESYGLYPAMQTFAQWLERNKTKFERVFNPEAALLV
jgi:uncharacterized protein YbjT (DUF2867 family)